MFQREPLPVPRDIQSSQRVDERARYHVGEPIIHGFQTESTLDLPAMFSRIDEYRELFQPAGYKFGITHSINTRFYNNEYGYFLKGFEAIVALYQGTPAACQELERLLIGQYKPVSGCMNEAPGGERPPRDLAYTYVAIANSAFALNGSEENHRLRMRHPRIVTTQGVLVNVDN